MRYHHSVLTPPFAPLILGIDPGFERVGFGLVRKEGSKLICVEHGLIHTPRIEFPDRLSLIYNEITQLIERTKPDAFAIEKLLFSVNVKTAMDVAKALGVILLAANKCNLPIAEYGPSEVKLAVVGNGKAEKKQVQFMVTKLLGLTETPKPDDVADALALAICHALRMRVPAQR
jgi:crossover junction endodeoxyribonuclease RuvC